MGTCRWLGTQDVVPWVYSVGMRKYSLNTPLSTCISHGLKPGPSQHCGCDECTLYTIRNSVVEVGKQRSSRRKTQPHLGALFDRQQVQVFGLARTANTIT